MTGGERNGQKNKRGSTEGCSLCGAWLRASPSSSGIKTHCLSQYSQKKGENTHEEGEVHLLWCLSGVFS